jgi:hypothetical protein
MICDQLGQLDTGHRTIHLRGREKTTNQIRQISRCMKKPNVVLAFLEQLKQIQIQKKENIQNKLNPYKHDYIFFISNQMIRI